jgi:hypothetical protein
MSDDSKKISLTAVIVGAVIMAVIGAFVGPDILSAFIDIDAFDLILYRVPCALIGAGIGAAIGTQYRSRREAVKTLTKTEGKYCTNCGKELVQESKFCNNCGHSVAAEQ